MMIFLSSLIVSTAASAAIYQGKNIDGNRYPCSGVALETPYEADNLTCQFNGKKITVTGRFKIFPINRTETMDSEVVTDAPIELTVLYEGASFRVDVMVDFKHPHALNNFAF
ncbi:MAG: hypothetical protein ACPGUD_08680 [Parashewanella sp.]